MLHDVGQIGTPDQILLKTSALTDEERALMQRHPESGARMLANIPEMEDVADIVRYHHENFDGTGYPEGLKENQIPPASRIIHLADVYDSLASPRPFLESFSHQSAIEHSEQESGTQFDPQVVSVFCSFEALARLHHSIANGLFGTRPSIAKDMADLSDAGLDELVRMVESEPVLAAFVLRAANADNDKEPVACLRAACNLLGKVKVRALAQQSSALDGCLHEPDRLLEHSLRCAMAARLLAEKTAVLNPDEAYMLGLTHDIGKLLMLALSPNEMENIIWLDDAGRSDREIAAFGIDHAEVGHLILNACKLPHALIAIIQTPHDAMRTHTPAPLLLHLADAIAGTDKSHQAISLDSFGTDLSAMLKLSRADIADIQTQITQDVESQFAFS